jgi:hypothetical protein
LAEANTLVLDLSRPWSPSTVNFSVITKPNGVPILIHPTLWYDKARNELIQGFGGLVSSWAGSGVASSRSLSLWRLRLSSGGGSGGDDNDDTGRRDATWTEALYTNHQALSALTRPVMGLTAYADDSAYVLGGYASGQDEAKPAADMTPLPGLVHYNMSSGTFVNASATQYYGRGTAQRGQMVHVPAFGGARGLYAMLSGYSSPLARFRPGQGQLSFANITLYDPATQQWYWQEARGDVPRPRDEFCATGARSTKGTYEM